MTSDNSEKKNLIKIGFLIMNTIYKKLRQTVLSSLKRLGIHLKYFRIKVIKLSPLEEKIQQFMELCSLSSSNKGSRMVLALFIASSTRCNLCSSFAGIDLTYFTPIHKKNFHTIKIDSPTITKSKAIHGKC